MHSGPCRRELWRQQVGAINPPRCEHEGRASSVLPRTRSGAGEGQEALMLGPGAVLGCCGLCSVDRA